MQDLATSCRDGYRTAQGAERVRLLRSASRHRRRASWGPAGPANLSFREIEVSRRRVPTSDLLNVKLFGNFLPPRGTRSGAQPSLVVDEQCRNAGGMGTSW